MNFVKTLLLKKNRYIIQMHLMKNKCHVHLFIVEWDSVLPNYKVKSSSVTRPVEVKNRLQWVIGNSALEFIIRISSPIACNIHNLYLPAGPLLPSPLSIYPPPSSVSQSKVKPHGGPLVIFTLFLLSIPPLSPPSISLSLSHLPLSFSLLYLSIFPLSPEVHYWNDDSFTKK